MEYTVTYKYTDSASSSSQPSPPMGAMASHPPPVKEGLGEKEGFKKLKLKLKNHEASQFEIDTNKFSIELRNDGDPVKTLSKLEHLDASGRETELKNAVFIQVEDKELTFDVAVKDPGWYKLNIFAAPKTQESSSLPGVFTYLFYVSRIRERVSPYPHQFADWSDGCRLYEPLTIDESCNLDKVKFKVKIPGARKVAVKAGDVWTHLEKEGGDKWKGEVRLREQFREPHNVKISLNANMGGPDENSYATMLQYNTKPE